jgi:flagellar motor switch protein FliM
MATLDTTEQPVAEGLPITPDQQGAMPPPAANTHQPFRFTAAASLSPSRAESLESWHRPFLRIAAANLRSVLRLDVDLEIDTIRVESCAQLLAARAEHNQALVFRMAPQPDVWLLDLPLPLASLVVERMLGGAADQLSAAAEPPELTELEQIIFRQFASTLLKDYARNWEPHRELKPEIVRATRAIRAPRVLGCADDDLLVRVGLTFVLKESKTPFSLFLPIAAVEELLQRLGAHDDSARAAAPAFKHDPRSPIAAVPVPVSIRWQGFQIKLSEVAALEPGDLLVLDQKKCDHGVVFLGERARFAGKISREPHKTVITLTHPLE